MEAAREAHYFQGSEANQLQGYLPIQLLSRPCPPYLQPNHAAVVVGCDSRPFAQRSVAQPVSAVLPVWSVQGIVEGDQDSLSDAGEPGAGTSVSASSPGTASPPQAARIVASSRAAMRASPCIQGPTRSAGFYLRLRKRARTAGLLTSGLFIGLPYLLLYDLYDFPSSMSYILGDGWQKTVLNILASWRAAWQRVREFSPRRHRRHCRRHRCSYERRSWFLGLRPDPRSRRR